MKHRLVWAGALALAATITSQINTLGQTNGVILISVRNAQDLGYSTTDAFEQKGPGQATPGDVQMAELLGDYGYSCRIIVDKELNANYATYAGSPTPYFTPANPDFNAEMVIISGSSGSADIGQMRGWNVPIIIGEHSCIGDRTVTCACLLYTNGTQSGNITDTTGYNAGGNPPTTGPGGQYMLVLHPEHPIMQGIPLDSLNRVKIMRDKYPEENAHVPPSGKPNYVYSWNTEFLTNAAPGTAVIGILDPNTTGYTNDNQRAVFAVNDIGGILGDGSVNTNRIVHWIVNEDGSGGSRRMFNALTDIGRVIFIRTVKWALGQPLAPYVPLGPVKISMLPASQVQLAWTGTSTKNYKVLGTQNLFGPPNFSNWQTVAQDIHGVDGVDATTVKLDMSAVPQYVFLRVMPVP